MKRRAAHAGTLALLALCVVGAQAPASQPLAGAGEASRWIAAPADGVELRITQDGDAVRLDFDFHGHGGWTHTGGTGTSLDERRMRVEPRSLPNGSGARFTSGNSSTASTLRGLERGRPIEARAASISVCAQRASPRGATACRSRSFLRRRGAGFLDSRTLRWSAPSARITRAYRTSHNSVAGIGGSRLRPSNTGLA